MSGKVAGGNVGRRVSCPDAGERDGCDPFSSWLAEDIAHLIIVIIKLDRSPRS